MTLALTDRRAAIKTRLDEVYGSDPVHTHFNVALTRQAKHTPRAIKVTWGVYPLDEEVQQVLGDLYAADVLLDRRRMWSCGRFHADEMEAWKEHEGRDYLEYEDAWGDPLGLDEKVLPEHVQEELSAAGETFESACVPGNFIKCPTCGGGSRIMPDRKTFKLEPCPDCARLGLDRSAFYPGILNLDVPEHREFYAAVIERVRAEAAREAAREQAKRDRALSVPTTHAAPTWVALPTREAGLVNGIPVAPNGPGCDYLAHAEDPERRSRCGNRARWFDPTTGLRVCTRHKTAQRSEH